MDGTDSRSWSPAKTFVVVHLRILMLVLFSWLTVLVSPRFKEIFSLIRKFSRSTKVWYYRLWVHQEVIICVIFLKV